MDYAQYCLAQNVISDDEIGHKICHKLPYADIHTRNMEEYHFACKYNKADYYPYKHFLLLFGHSFTPLHYDSAVRLDLLAACGSFLHNIVEACIICSNGELLRNKAYGCGLNAVYLVNSVFHFLSAVCAVKILKLKYLFHNNISFKIIFIFTADDLRILAVVL